MSGEQHKSKYAAKRAAGKQMYGPGCCGHSVSEAQISACRRKAHIQQRMMRPEPEPAITWSEGDAS